MGYRHWIKGFISLMMVLSTVFSGIETASAFTRSDYFQTKSQAQATLKIALLAPITGPAAAFGASSQKGAQMAIDEWNAEGGVLGNSVALEIKDTQCDPTAAADAANAVVSEDIHYIIGEVCSSASLSIAQIAEDNHIVQITPLSTNPRVTLNDDDTTKQFVFRACFIDAYQGGMMAKFALDNNWTKAFVLHDPSSAYSTELAAAFRDAYDDAGGAIVGDDSYQSSDTDFTTLIDSIKTSQADIVYLPDYSNIANPFLAQARASGVSATFLGGDGWDSGDLDGTATEGSYFTTHFSKDDNHLTVHKWVSQYVTKYNQDPDLSAALTYEAVDILLTAIQSAGADDPSLVKDILAGLDFNSLTGSLTFDAQHNPNKPVIIKQVQGNSPVFYTRFTDPDQPATTVTAALLAPLSGPVQAYGKSAIDGVEMAIVEWNAAGGVLGKQVDLLVEDSRCDADLGVAAAHKVIDQDGVQYIIGEVCSGASIPISQVTEASQVLQLSPSSTDPRVTLNENGTTKQYVFRACFIDPFQGEMMAKFALQQNLKKAFILHDPNDDYSTGLAAAFRSAYQSGGGSVVGDETYDAANQDFQTLVTAIQVAQPDLVYLPDFADVVNVLVAQARNAGVTATFMGGDGWDSDDLNTDVFEGSFFTGHFAKDDPRPTVQQWVSQFQAAYGYNPDGVAALSYDAAQMLLTAIQSAGVNDPMLVKDSLAMLHYDGVTGYSSFDGHHNPYKPVVVEQIKDHVATYVTSMEQFGTISGHVYKADGTLINDAQIRVKAIGVNSDLTTQETLVVQANGSYTLTGLIPGTYKILANSGKNPDYGSLYYPNQLNLDLAHVVTMGPDDTIQQIDFHLVETETITIQPSDPATLVYTPPQGTATEIAIPAGAVTTTTTLIFTPASADSGSGFIFQGTAFNLDAYQGGVQQHGFMFDPPIVISLHYSDTPQESDLKLYYWDENSTSWEDAVCPGSSYTRDLLANTLSVPVCHLSSFALMRQGHLIFLPVTINK